MEAKQPRRLRNGILIPGFLGLALLFIAFHAVRIFYVGVVYGFPKAIAGQIHIKEIGSKLVVSNGDVLTDLHSFLFAVAVYAIVAPSWLFLLRRLGYI